MNDTPDLIVRWCATVAAVCVTLGVVALTVLCGVWAVRCIRDLWSKKQ